MADRFEKERKIAALTFEKRQIAERAKEINGELEKLEDEVLEQWAAESVKGVPLTNAVLSMRREGFVKIVLPEGDGDEGKATRKAVICGALKAAGYGEYVTEGYNSKSVSSLAKEEHWDRDLPPELEGVLLFEPKYKIVVKAKKAKEQEAPEQLAPVSD